MRRRTAAVLATLMCAVALMVMTTVALAAELPEGVSVKVLAEFPSDIPGIAKIRHLEFRMEPGAKWENLVEDNTAL